MPAESRSWWHARDPEIERFTDNIVPRVASAWPAHHHVADAAADIAMSDASDADAIAHQATQDPDGAFARLQQMQRRLEGQIAAARDWADDSENPIWADHPFVGPMLENNRGRDLLRLTDPVHQDQQRAVFGRTVAAALDAAMAAEHPPVSEDAKRFLGYVDGALPGAVLVAEEKASVERLLRGPSGAPAWRDIDPRAIGAQATDNGSPIPGKVLFSDERYPYDVKGHQPVEMATSDRFFDYSQAGPVFDGLKAILNPRRFDLSLSDRIKAAKITGEASHLAATQEGLGSLVGGRLDRGERDAFRHAIWSYGLVRNLGPAIAKELTDAHERVPNNSPGERLMDLHNNWVARRLALDPRNWGRDPTEVIREAFSRGLLRTSPFLVHQSP